jgi:hypothetical protein
MERESNILRAADIGLPLLENGQRAVIHFQPWLSLSLSFIFSFALLPHKAIIAIKMKYRAMQSESVRPYIANALGHHAEAHERKCGRYGAISAESSHSAAAFCTSPRAPTLFSTRLFAIRFDRFYQLNWIRSAGPFLG